MTKFYKVRNASDNVIVAGNYQLNAGNVNNAALSDDEAKLFAKAGAELEEDNSIEQAYDTKGAQQKNENYKAPKKASSKKEESSDSSKSKSSGDSNNASSKSGDNDMTEQNKNAGTSNTEDKQPEKLVQQPVNATGPGAVPPNPADVGTGDADDNSNSDSKSSDSKKSSDTSKKK